MILALLVGIYFYVKRGSSGPTKDPKKIEKEIAKLKSDLSGKEYAVFNLEKYFMQHPEDEEAKKKLADLYRDIQELKNKIELKNQEKDKIIIGIA